MGCYNCKYLVASNKNEGSINGCLYYCTKQKKYVSGASDGCNSYYKDYSRKGYENDEIYHNGVHFSDSNVSIGTSLFFAIVLFIIAIIVNIFG